MQKLIQLLITLKTNIVSCKATLSLDLLHEQFPERVTNTTVKSKTRYFASIYNYRISAVLIRLMGSLIQKSVARNKKVRNNYKLIFILILLSTSNVYAGSLLDSLKSESLKQSANFIQQKYIEAFDEVMVSKGQMQVINNGFVINYTEPFRYSLSYDGETIKNINIDMGTETVIKVKDNPVMMVVMNYFNHIMNLHFDKLDKDFNIKEFKQKLSLTPKNSTLAKYVTSIEIVFKNKMISIVTIHSKGKEYTSFEIQNMK